MTTNKDIRNDYSCPAEDTIKLMGAKWHPQIFRLTAKGAVRFSSILRELPQASKQSISVALRELEQAGMLIRETIKAKPLHVEYRLSQKGRAMLEVYKQLAIVSKT